MGMQAAFGKMEITPSADMLGAYRRSPDRKARGTHDPLLARWGIFEQEGERSYALTEKHASAIAEKVRHAAPCSYPDPKPFSIRAAEWIVAIRDDLPEPEEVRRQVEKRLAEVEASATESPDSIWNWVRTQRLAEYSSIFYPAFNRVVTQCVSLGGRTLLFLPGEWFVQFGLSLKADRPQLHPLWIGYSNGHIGYLPRSEEYDQGYMLKKSSNFLKRGESERLYEKVLHWLE